MGYDIALALAWTELNKLAQEKHYTLRFLNDAYRIDWQNKQILSSSCQAPAKPHYSILLLHYLAKKLAGLSPVTGQWVSFRELSGAGGYYPAFKKRVIDVIMQKYSSNPQALLQASLRLQARETHLADMSVIVDVFDSVPILITFWRADEEFAPELNVLFDQSISDIFCTEDVVVLAEVMAYNICR